MTADRLGEAAERFVLAARRHPECRKGDIVSVDEQGALIALDMNVEMPLAFKADGISPNGVLTSEIVQVRLRGDYPWSSPSFYLREDFPRDLPHLEPASLGRPPRPCLVDGDQREYFFQFGLVELGVFRLIHQLALWLQRAAEGTLIHHGRGWEPTLRRNLSNCVSVDAEACRSAVDRNGGHRILKARFSRTTEDEKVVGDGAYAALNVSQEPTYLKREDKSLFSVGKGKEILYGETVCCLVWPDKLPSGKPFVAETYLPETVDTYGRLLERADELGCGRSLRLFFSNLQRVFEGYLLERPTPIAVILCARRPYALAGSSSEIELLPYVLEFRALKGRTSLLPAGEKQPVAPAMHVNVVNMESLRAISGAPKLSPVSMIGCGSVGSKMAMHLARSGIEVAALSDSGSLRPHHMARHAVVRAGLAGNKALELAEELKLLGQSPSVQQDDVLLCMENRDLRRKALPKGAAFAINTTASLGVREALSTLAANDVKTRISEGALFGRGDGGFLLLEGLSRNPTLCDLIAELYATVEDQRLRKLLFDPEFGLTEVQIGQGCGSLTMPMTDMRLSAMTAALTEHFVDSAQSGAEAGRIVIGAKAEKSSDTAWQRYEVAPFEVVSIEGPEEWTVRISRRVIDQIRSEVRQYPGVETGGVLIGTCSARLRAVTVIDVLAAPEDSLRSASRFVLGTKCLRTAIRKRHRQSGDTLFDVGTWHSHLADQGPSQLDRDTAKKLAEERPPPSVLLICAPSRFYALMHGEHPHDTRKVA
jgi:hypothetical protein